MSTSVEARAAVEAAHEAARREQSQATLVVDELDVLEACDTDDEDVFGGTTAAPVADYGWIIRQARQVSAPRIVSESWDYRQAA